MNDLISVIVPVYNVEKYIFRCVDSIINQTYKNIEILLIDDGSTDNCGQICDDYAKKDERVKVVHKKNGGLSDARNNGIDIANGDYLCFVDSDDYIDLEMIERLYKRLIKDDSDISLCDCCSFSDDLNADRNAEIEDRIIHTDEIFDVFLGTKGTLLTIACGKMYNKKLFNNIRYPYGKINEDEFVVHRILKQCKKISVLKEKMYYYYQRNGSIMHSPYSERNLDYADALIDRFEFAKTDKNYKLMCNTYNNLVGVVAKGYRSLDLKNKNIKKRLFNLKKIISNSLFDVVLRKECSREMKMKCFIFALSPKLYNMILSKSYKV